MISIDENGHGDPGKDDLGFPKMVDSLLVAPLCMLDISDVVAIIDDKVVMSGGSHLELDQMSIMLARHWMLSEAEARKDSRSLDDIGESPEEEEKEFI
jgi:hypothetical protein